MRIVLLDFCETCVDFQTADAYVNFVLEQNGGGNAKFTKLYSICQKTHVLGILERVFPKSSISKKLCLLQIKGLSQNDLVRYARLYYEKRLKPHFIVPVISEVIKLRDSGYRICVVSGGYDVYLEFFRKEFRINDSISAVLKFNDGIFTGKLDGFDCMFDNKVKLIEKFLPTNEDRREWMALTDSITDLPMLSMVGVPVVISHYHSQKWAEKRGFRQIIWN